MRPTIIAVACVSICLVPGRYARAQEPPSLRWDRPIHCMVDDYGKPMRVQCDRAKRVCLYSRTCEEYHPAAGVDCQVLERLETCVEPPEGERFADMKAANMQFVEARAETPPGFSRDDRGRVFQTEFDVNQRVTLGGDWAPMMAEGGRESVGRASIHAGIHGEWSSYDTRLRQRLTVLETKVFLNPASAEGMLLRYDESRESETPLLRVTTFWPPARHDVYFNLGFWAELAGVEIRPRAAPDETHVRVAAMGGSWDLWRDDLMESYLRVRFGGGLDDHYSGRADVGHRLAATPVGALEADFLIGDAGFHRLSLSSVIDAPFVWEEDEHASPTPFVDFDNELAYELIVLALNDQPVSLRLAVGGGYRDDLTAEYDGWEVSGGAGLRLNFWAPPPDHEERQRARVLRRGGPAVPAEAP